MEKKESKKERVKALRELLKVQCKTFYALNREIGKNLAELWKCEH